jgi:SAM-dependent methyltransferase
MPGNGWKSPLYSYDAGSLIVDVTSSISSGLPPHRCIKSRFMAVLDDLPRQRVLDFGAGALRHTLPLLRHQYEVCAVEFEEAFVRAEAADARGRAENSSNFSTLMWPKSFKKDRRRFDAALLTYVLQVMPEKKERDAVVEAISHKLTDSGCLLYMSRTGQITPEMKSRPLNDGYWMWPGRQRHSFYREFSTEETHELFARHGLKREASWSEGGKEQVLLYRKAVRGWG